jgi:hypothetical protein
MNHHFSAGKNPSDRKPGRLTNSFQMILARQLPNVKRSNNGPLVTAQEKTRKSLVKVSGILRVVGNVQSQSHCPVLECLGLAFSRRAVGGLAESVNPHREELDRKRTAKCVSYFVSARHEHEPGGRSTDSKYARGLIHVLVSPDLDLSHNRDIS